MRKRNIGLIWWTINLIVWHGFVAYDVAHCGTEWTSDITADICVIAVSWMMFMFELR